MEPETGPEYTDPAGRTWRWRLYPLTDPSLFAIGFDDNGCELADCIVEVDATTEQNEAHLREAVEAFNDRNTP